MRVAICMLHIRNYHMYAIIYVSVICVYSYTRYIHVLIMNLIIYVTVICVYPYACFICMIIIYL